MSEGAVDLLDLFPEIGLERLSGFLKMTHFLFWLKDIVLDVFDFLSDLVNDFDFLLNTRKHFLNLGREISVKHVADLGFVHFQFLQLAHPQIVDFL